MAGALVLAIGLVGLVNSVYLTYVHYSGGALACARDAVVNCDLVTRSSYAYIPGTPLPVSLAGLVWFALCGVLGVATSVRPRDLRLWSALLAWAVVAMGPVLYLVWAEIVPLGHLCEYCSVAHALALLALLVALQRTLGLLAERGTFRS